MVKGLLTCSVLLGHALTMIFKTARTNSVMFYLLWSSAPILVSVTAFFVYVMQGNKLTISTAFTVCKLPDVESEMSAHVL